MAKARSSKKQYLLMLVLCGVLLALQYHLWTGQGGLWQFWQLKQSIKQQAQDNAVLEARNSRLHAEVIDLKQGHAAIEERARSELGMIKDGEVFYQIIEQNHE